MIMDKTCIIQAYSTSYYSYSSSIGIPKIIQVVHIKTLTDDQQHTFGMKLNIATNSSVECATGWGSILAAFVAFVLFVVLVSIVGP